MPPTHKRDHDNGLDVRARRHAATCTVSQRPGLWSSELSLGRAGGLDWAAMDASSPPRVTPPTAEPRGAEECGWSAAPQDLCTWAKLPILLAKMTVAGLHRMAVFSAAQVLTLASPRAYIID